MPASILAAAQALRDALAGFEPGIFSGTDCAQVADALAATEKACAAARLLSVARAVETGAHRDQGFKDGASWVARQTGTTGSQARKALDTADRLGNCPDTKQAFLAGEISFEQAHEITETPAAESELLQTARRGDLSSVRDHAREFRQTHTDPTELRRRHFELREFRHWRDREGMVRFAGALPPETGLPFVKRIDAAALRLRKAVRARGEKAERFEAYAADALAQAVCSSGADPDSASPRVDLNVVCDLNALRRGWKEPGEPCHIIDGPPITPEIVKELCKDAFIKVVLHDGVNILTVKHYGRHMPAALRTAMDLGPVPEFTGRACVNCGRKWGNQYDHFDPVANGGPTEYANLQSLCWHCHQDKTERDRAAGLLGPNPKPKPKPKAHPKLSPGPSPPLADTG